jgi:hypothetical protein
MNGEVEEAPTSIERMMSALDTAHCPQCGPEIGQGPEQPSFHYPFWLTENANYNAGELELLLE